MLLIVAGHHRSGTSLLAQLLSAAGLYLGDALMPGRESNPHGHQEDLEVVSIHDRILADNGRTWQVTEDFIPVINRDQWGAMSGLVGRRELRHRLWGFKDPRACLFLSAWKHLAPEAKILLTFRHPADCVDSIERREARNMIEGILPAEECLPFWTEPDHGLRLWAVHNRALLRAAEAYPDDVLVTRFTDLRDDRDVVGAINRRWDLGLRPVRPAQVFDADAVTAADVRLGVRSPELLIEVDRLWAELTTLADRTREAVPT